MMLCVKNGTFEYCGIWWKEVTVPNCKPSCHIVMARIVHTYVCNSVSAACVKVLTYFPCVYCVFLCPLCDVAL